MDSRHESHELEILNELIDSINIYILDNLDEIVIRDKLLLHMRDISKYIYDYAHIQIDVNEFISKKNLLSIDIVHLPKLPEEALFPHNGNGKFHKMLEEIHSIVDVNASEDYYVRKFKDELQRLLRKYS